MPWVSWAEKYIQYRCAIYLHPVLSQFVAIKQTKGAVHIVQVSPAVPAISPGADGDWFVATYPTNRIYILFDCDIPKLLTKYKVRLYEEDIYDISQYIY